MKFFKQALVLAIFAFAAITASAQGKVPFNQKKAADHQTEQMASDLGLNADQKKKVAALNATRDQQHAAIRAELKASTTKESPKPSEAAKAKAKESRKAMRQEYRQGLKAVLTPEQFEKWKEMNKEAKRDKTK